MAKLRMCHVASVQGTFELLDDAGSERCTVHLCGGRDLRVRVRTCTTAEKTHMVENPLALPFTAGSTLLVRSEADLGVGVLLDTSLLGDSLVLRKLIGKVNDGRGVLVGPVFFKQICQVVTPPATAAQLLSWLQAIDFLCARPCAAHVLFAAQRGLRASLSTCLKSERDLGRSVCDGYVDPGESVRRRAFLEKSLRKLASDMEPRAPLLVPSGASAPPSTVQPSRKRSRVDRENPDEETPDTPEALLAACEGLLALAAHSPGRASQWEHVRDLVKSALLGFCDSEQACSVVFDLAPRLLPLLTPEEGRWLLHRAMVVLEAMEQAGHPAFLGLRELLAAQRLYKEQKLDIDTLLPTARLPRATQAAPLFLLPCCQGRADVAPLLSSCEAVHRACCRALPWLEHLWRSAGRLLLLTGSLLTQVLRQAPTQEAGDVDIFVESPAHLVMAKDWIREAVREHCGVAFREEHVVERQVSARKFRLHIVAADLPVTWVDLYAHPRAQVLRYHVSLVRVAFDGTELFCAPSSVVALATSVSVSFRMEYKKETAAAVLLRKWSQGACLLVSEQELLGFLRCVARFSAAERALVDSVRPKAALVQAALTRRGLLAVTRGLRFHFRSVEGQAEIQAKYGAWREASCP